MDYRQKVIDFAMETENTAALKKLCRIIDGSGRPRREQRHQNDVEIRY